MRLDRVGSGLDVACWMFVLVFGVRGIQSDCCAERMSGE